MLSLLQNPVASDDRNTQKRQNQLYRDMLADTNDTFGALELKADKIKQNVELKRFQIMPIATKCFRELRDLHRSKIPVLRPVKILKNYSTTWNIYVGHPLDWT
jgi:hypothetical protein